MAKMDLDTLFPQRVTHLAEVRKAGGFCADRHDGYSCTMPLNHEGDHIAHGSLMDVCEQWTASNGSIPVSPVTP